MTELEQGVVIASRIPCPRLVMRDLFAILGRRMEHPL